MAERVGLAGFGAHYPHQLSGGGANAALAQMIPNNVDGWSHFPALDVQTRQLMENGAGRRPDEITITISSRMIWKRRFPRVHLIAS
jgi:ABC-type nitrate/sulfonate/bicarbonate transport system ATPase subunit